MIREGNPCLFSASEEKIMGCLVKILFITSNSHTKDYKSYTIWHIIKTNKATGPTRCALESWASKLFNAYLACPVALLVFAICQIVYNL